MTRKILNVYLPMSKLNNFIVGFSSHGSHMCDKTKDKQWINFYVSRRVKSINDGCF